MSNIHQQPQQEPAVEDLEEPSTEKEPGEEPKAEHPGQPEPDHNAVGIGVVGGPQSDAADAETADARTAPATDEGQPG